MEPHCNEIVILFLIRRSCSKSTSEFFVGYWIDGAKSPLADRKRGELLKYPILQGPCSIYRSGQICYRSIINNESWLTSSTYKKPTSHKPKLVNHKVDYLITLKPTQHNRMCYDNNM